MIAPAADGCKRWLDRTPMRRRNAHVGQIEDPRNVLDRCVTIDRGPGEFAVVSPCHHVNEPNAGVLGSHTVDWMITDVQ